MSTMTRSKLYFFLAIYGIISGQFAFAFVLSPVAITTNALRLQTTTLWASFRDWTPLTDGVQKRILHEGSGDLAQPGQTVEIDYVGTLGDIDWDVEGVIACWLLTQQGLEGLAEGFREAGVDASKLMDEGFFTEDFVSETLGVSNRIQIKKLVMASKRLSNAVQAYPAGTQFDSNQDRNDGAPYSFVLGKKKAIQAMELAVASMKQGEHAEIICRAEYAYGKEGLRKSNGNVMVPEYATLCFDVKLRKCT